MNGKIPTSLLDVLGAFTWNGALRLGCSARFTESVLTRSPTDVTSFGIIGNNLLSWRDC